MSLDDKFIPIQLGFYDTVSNFFKTLAKIFGYPNNTGLPKVPYASDEVWARTSFLENLPIHRTSWPPVQRPETWFEVFFSPSPKLDTVRRYIYESKDEGFYNFYIENYKNIYFLPDWFSEFIQVRLNFCLDITALETFRELLFVALVVYSQVVMLRIALSWFIFINPYTFPWCYLAAAVDWTEEVLQGIVPSVLGVNITGTVFLGVLGVIADSLNHLVLTMPFLPSEGEKSKLLINGELKDVLVFHYLPLLWYRHTIPNELREFWYKDRPDILDYMKKSYQNLDIQFFPNNIEIPLNSEKLTAELITVFGSFNNNYSHFMSTFSTEILSKTTENQWVDLNTISEYYQKLQLPFF
jgi:uncharacterized protein YggT (Ycf19 family)